MVKVSNEDKNVLEAAIERLEEYFKAGDRVVVATSGGKDSTVCLELTLMVAKEFDALPLDVVMRDEEIMVPGTFEYLERVYHRPEVNFVWLSARDALINPFNRAMPFWWVFDPKLEPEQWVRQPPDFVEWTDEQPLTSMVSLERFPPDEGKRLIAVTGLRTQESLKRMSRIASTGGALTKHPSDYGAYTLAPIYDWSDSDVWKFIKDYQLDYNEAYNHLYRVGVPRRNLRIAEPTMREGLSQLSYLPQAFPEWFEKVAKRVDGIRQVAYYGKSVIQPHRDKGETWEEYMLRQIKEDYENPDTVWLAQRAETAVKSTLSQHARHSTAPLPQLQRNGCKLCPPTRRGSWQALAKSLYDGDPFATKNQMLDPVEPSIFRADAPKWFKDGQKKIRLRY